MRRESATILRDATAACEEIAAMLDGVTEAAFLADRRTQRATERCFEIVGEALVRLARDFPALADRIPEHRRVIDFRNLLAHGYDIADPRLVFNLAKTRLPALLEALRSAAS